VLIAGLSAIALKISLLRDKREDEEEEGGEPEYIYIN
jgi:hypothetical protein